MIARDHRVIWAGNSPRVKLDLCKENTCISSLAALRREHADGARTFESAAAPDTSRVWKVPRPPLSSDLAADWKVRAPSRWRPLATCPGQFYFGAVMLKSSARSVIRLRGARHNNLKNFDLDLPLNQLIVITGLSGSGKSSLAFDTLFAEGQRRYIETFSPYARQFFDRMDKPQVDSIEGIPPAIAIEQRNAVRTTRSTVGTMTEICDYMKMLWPHVAQLYCRQCGQLVRKDSPQSIWDCGLRDAEGGSDPVAEVLVTFDLPLSEKLSLEESLALVSKQGYQRLLVDGRVVRLDEVLSNVAQHKKRLTSLTVIQDRVKLALPNRARFVEACEQAYHFGKGKLAIYDLAGRSEERRVGK